MNKRLMTLEVGNSRKGTQQLSAVLYRQICLIALLPLSSISTIGFTQLI